MAILRKFNLFTSRGCRVETPLAQPWSSKSIEGVGVSQAFEASLVNEVDCRVKFTPWIACIPAGATFSFQGGTGVVSGTKSTNHERAKSSQKLSLPGAGPPGSVLLLLGRRIARKEASPPNIFEIGWTVRFSRGSGCNRYAWRKYLFQLFNCTSCDLTCLAKFYKIRRSRLPSSIFGKKCIFRQTLETGLGKM